MATVKFDRNYLKEKLGLPYAAIEDKIIDKSRWSIHHEIIFTDNGKFYRAYYSEGATECQDERAWEYDNEVECEEVYIVEKLVKVWEVIK